LQEDKSILEKGQTKILGSESVIWDQTFEIWPQKGHLATLPIPRFFPTTFQKQALSTIDICVSKQTFDFE